MTNPEDKSSAARSRSEFGELVGEQQSPHYDGAEENYDEAADELIGAVLNERYEILSRIGHGGMGIVYRGRHILMDKLVAIKVLSTNYINDENASLRFRHEAKVACQLASSNVSPDRTVTIVADGENSPAKEKWSMQFKEAQAAFDANKYADAESLLRRALAEARHTGDKSDLLVTLRKLEDVLYVQQKFQDADSLNKEIQRLSTPSNSNGGIVTLTTESDSSGTTVKESQNIPDRSISPPAEQDDRVAELAMFCHKKGQCTTATSLLEHALEISKKMYGPRSLKTADRMSELASLYLALEQKEKAQTLMKQVLDIKSHQNSKSK